MRKDAIGVVFVNGHRSDEHHHRDLERMLDYFVNKPKLEPKSCVVFHFDPEKARGSESVKNLLRELFYVLESIFSISQRFRVNFDSFWRFSSFVGSIG